MANQAESIDLFMTAANNIILLADYEQYRQINNGDLVQKAVTMQSTQGGRNRVAMFNRLKAFSDYLGGICGTLAESEWTLLRTRLAADKNSGFMDYRINTNNVDLWCTLTVERVEGQFKITDLFNHFYNLGLTDFVQSFIELDTNERISIPTNQVGRKTLYSEIDSGLAAVDAYLQQASVATTLPLVRRIRLELIDGLTDPAIRQKALLDFVKPYGMSRQYPIQQLLLDLDSPLDESNLFELVQLAEQITGDRSAFRSIAASYLLENGHSDLAKFYVHSAILAEPTHAKPYFVLFDWQLSQRDFSSAIQTLKVLEENLGYEFERKNFLSNERYAELIQQPLFNDWLPKS